MTREKGSADANSDPDAQATQSRDPEQSADDESGSVGARVDSVLAAAESAAAGIREEAREWARQHKEEAQRRVGQLAAKQLSELSRLAERLSASAQVVSKECDELIRAIEESGDELGHEDLGPRLRIAGVGPEGDDAMPVPAEPGGSASRADAPIPDRARLFAAQMIAAGNPRDEISQRLRQEFGIQDANAMLDRMGA